MKVPLQPDPSNFSEDSAKTLVGPRRLPTIDLAGPPVQGPRKKFGSHRRMPQQTTKIDLNLLRILDVVLEERSVTRASARLDLTQSAVSHALSRLRRALGDELFHRNAEGLQPTPRALEIAPTLHAALNQMRRALSPVDFDPAISNRTFSLVADSNACAALIPALVVQMQAMASNVRLDVSENSPDLAQRLDSREVDFVLGAVSAAPDRFACEPLMREDLVWIVRPGHPLTRREVTLEALAAAPHVVVSGQRTASKPSMITMQPSWEDPRAVDAELARKGLQRRIGVVTPDIYSARAIVIGSDMAALAPRRLALVWAQNNLVSLIEAYECPPAVVSLLYRKDRLAEAPVAWMRGLLKRL
jgi:DNA-binding transcriptional LysR family regulator